MARGDVQPASCVPASWPIPAAGLAAAFLVFAMQLAMAAGTVDEPFLDTCLHYFYDNAWFTTAARNANEIGFPGHRLGIVISLPHDRWQEPSGPPSFYVHHPYAMKLLMQHVMAVCGHEEWVSRAFALVVSMLASLGVLVTISLLTRSIAAGGLGAATFVSLPVMATFQTCLKFEIDGMAASAWVFPAVVALLGRPTAISRGLLVGMGIASGLTAWTGVIFATLTAGLLCLPGIAGRGVPPGRARQAAGLLVAGLGIALAVLLVAFSWQKGGVLALGADLGSAFRAHAERAGFTNREWLGRQVSYAWLGYGPVGLLLLAAGGVMAVTWLGRLVSGRESDTRASPALLSGFLAVSLATGFIWTVTFREGSYTHEYWSLPTSMGVAAVIPLLIARVSARHRPAALLCGTVVVLAAYLTSWQFFGHRLALWRAEQTAADIEFLESQRAEQFTEFVFLPLGNHPFNAWFQTRLFEYYTDRPLRRHEPGSPLTSDARLILLKYDDQASAEAFVEQKLQVRLRNRGCGPRFCVYEVREAQVENAADPAAGQGAAEAGSTARPRRSRASRF